MSKKFVKLEDRIELEYEKKGFSKKKAKYIGMASAGKVAREKKRKKINKRHDDF